METKIFAGKRITIKQLTEKDLKKVRQFQDFINSLIEEGAQISRNKKLTLKEERKWLEEEFLKIKNKKTVFLMTEHNNIIVGTAAVDLGRGRQSHVGDFGITIRKEYRGIGLGSYLTKAILKLAKKELKPRPKIIRLSVFATNKIAFALYKKFGFKKVAKIPEQIYYKGKLIDEIVMLRYL